MVKVSNEHVGLAVGGVGAANRDSQLFVYEADKDLVTDGL